MPIPLMHFRRAGSPKIGTPADLPHSKIQAFSTNVKTAWLEIFDDTQTGMLLGIPRSARCVQRFDDSRKICNSHYLSRFAASFIDARAKRSVAESCIFFSNARLHSVDIRVRDSITQVPKEPHANRVHRGVDKVKRASKDQ